jgi:hypothetical protein
LFKLSGTEIEYSAPAAEALFCDLWQTTFFTEYNSNILQLQRTTSTIKSVYYVLEKHSFSLACFSCATQEKKHMVFPFPGVG